MKKLNISMQILKINDSNTHLNQLNITSKVQKFDVTQASFVLKKLARSWSDRAQVKRFKIHEHDLFKEDADDFLVDLLPFRDHPSFLRASQEMKRKILSSGWIIYNQKTIAIETEIINPVCVNILSGTVPGTNDPVSRQIASETLVDESFHVLLVMNAIDFTCQKRGISIKIPRFNVVENMKRLECEHFLSWQRTLIQLATAIVSEIFISDYLKLLSESETIQPINRMTTKVHREDELAHSNIFKNLTKCIYANLNKKEREFFAEILAKPITWFADRELDVWQNVLEQIEFKDASQLIRDCKNVNSHCLTHVDYSELTLLAKEIGITDITIGLDSFYREGLIK